MKNISLKQIKVAWLAKQGKYPTSHLFGGALKLYKTQTFMQLKHLYNKHKKEKDNGNETKLGNFRNSQQQQCKEIENT